MPNLAPGYDVHPNHVIDIEPSDETVRIHLHGVMIAESDQALVLREAGYSPVFYLPRCDVLMKLAQVSQLSTYCPFKSHTSYFSFAVDGRVATNAAWIYEDPFVEVDQIREAIAFDKDLIDGIELL